MSSRQWASPSSSNARTPPGCSSSPTMRSGSLRLRSSSITLRPCLPNATAAAHPRIPAPTMTISASWCSLRRISCTSRVPIAASAPCGLPAGRVRSVAGVMGAVAVVVAVVVVVVVIVVDMVLWVKERAALRAERAEKG